MRVRIRQIRIEGPRVAADRRDAAPDYRSKNVDGYTFSSFTEMVVFYFPRVILLFVGIAMGIAVYDTLKPSRPPFGRMFAWAAAKFSSSRR
jgi:hypothetical protein